MENYERAALKRIIIELTTLLSDDTERKERLRSQFRLIKGNFGQQKEAIDLVVNKDIRANIQGVSIHKKGEENGKFINI